MTQQLPLAGFQDTQPPTDRLFFGIFPAACVGPSLTRTAHEIRIKHALTDSPLPEDRFHVTLFHLGDYLGLPESLVRSANEAAATLATPSFEVWFDFAQSFLTKSAKQPLVLRGSAGVDKLMDFQRSLGEALKKVGLGRHVRSQFTPHITLLYDTKAIAHEAVHPVSWRVREFVLVHSLLGQTRHVPIGRWALHGG